MINFIDCKMLAILALVGFFIPWFDLYTVKPHMGHPNCRLGANRIRSQEYLDDLKKRDRILESLLSALLQKAIWQRKY